MFSAGSYLKIWRVAREADKYCDVQASTSRKNQDGTFENDFSGFVRLVGHAANQIKGKDLTKGGFKIKDCGVTQIYNKEKNQTYTNFIVFEFEDNETSGDIFTSFDLEELPFH
ncbi:MAG: hypothetical protein ACOYBE_01565 [Blautia sp.]